MIIASRLNSVLNVKALVGTFNQEKALVGAFSVIVKTGVEPMDRFAALLKTTTMIPSPASEDCLASGIIQCPNVYSLECRGCSNNFTVLRDEK